MASGPAVRAAAGRREPRGSGLFNLAGTADLGDVYATINAELRSQYLLAFSTDERLEEKELRSLGVEVEGKGLDVRTVTLNR